MNSKAKGKCGELELAKELRKYGYDARQGQQYKGGADSPDVLGLPGIHVECKRVEHLNLDATVKQAIKNASNEEIPTVFHRKTWRMNGNNENERFYWNLFWMEEGLMTAEFC